MDKFLRSSFLLFESLFISPEKTKDESTENTQKECSEEAQKEIIRLMGSLGV